MTATTVSSIKPWGGKPVTALLFVGAFVAAVFFQGFYTDLFCIALSLLIVGGLGALWASYRDGLSFPKTGVALCLTLYWMWLALAGAWGRVGYVGSLNFWWLGTLPLVFWIYALSPQREQLWRYVFRWVVLIGVALALVASYQWLIYGHEPTAMFLNRNSLAALLNLIAIPLAGYFLLDPRGAPPWRHWILGASLFMLAFGMALIEGRGATISGAIALLILVGVAWRHVAKRFIVQLGIILLAAFLIASQLGRLGIGQRLETMVQNPYEAGAGRFVIWKQSWEMLKEAPWMGVGLGHYSLYWPPYRHPIDGSGGFFVHNDYLQIWIEAGLPGLLLLVAVLGLTLVLYWRGMRRSVSKSKQVEMTALFAGLLAVAMHSVVDFNLYVLSILLLAGLTLGRLHALVLTTQPTAAAIVIVPSKYLSKLGYRTLSSLLAAFALYYFVTLGFASFEYRRAVALIEESRWEEAYARLSNAALWYPHADTALVSQADLLRFLMSLDAGLSPVQRFSMFNEARRLLIRAEELNPLRPRIFAVRAHLYEQNPTLAGSDWEEAIARDYRRAIELEPREYRARTLYARFLSNRGQQAEARQVLEGGMKYVYLDVPAIVPYYKLTAEFRAEVGDRDGAADLLGRIKAIESARSTPLPTPDSGGSPSGP